MFEVPDEAVQALNLTPEAAGMEVRLSAAAKLFELGRLSSGAAAALAGVPRVEFLQRLSDYGVDTFDQTADELQRETPLAERH
ncbi:MAG: UPF0175 family protein [Planctomycetota bacterium]